MGAIWLLFSPCVSAGASAFKAVPLMRIPQWSHWWEAQCERGWPQPASPSQNWASTALGFPFIQRCPLWTKTWKDTENRQREWESGGKGRRFPAETCCAIFDRKVRWNDASPCPNIVSPPSINIEPYVSIIHSASFLLLLLWVSQKTKQKKIVVIHPRPCLCQGAVIILIPPMDQTSDLKRGPQDKPSSLESSRWGYWRQILSK